MALIAAKCTQCGAELQVESTNDATICSYCGSPFITQKAINHYQVTNKIQADVVHVYGSTDFFIRTGTLEEYRGASVDAILPDDVLRINKNAFRACTGLRSVHINEGVQAIEAGTFAELEQLEHVILPQSLKSIGVAAFESCALQQITLPNGIKHIEPETFSDCTHLSKVTLPNTLKSIGQGAFKNTALKEIALPDSIDYIGPQVFSGCTHLAEVSLPENLKHIEEECFFQCTSLTEIALPDGLESIGRCAFRDTGLTQIHILDSVHTLGAHAFVHTNIAQTNLVLNDVNVKCFYNSPLASRYLRRMNGWCEECGGKVSFFNKKCRSCGHINR